MSTIIDLKETIEDLKDKQANLDELINQLVKKYNLKAENSITERFIRRLILKYFGITEATLKGNSRTSHIVTARQFYFYLVRQYTGGTLQMIGKRIGKDHATVIHSCKKVKHGIKYYSDYKKIISELENEIMIYKHDLIEDEPAKSI